MHDDRHDQTLRPRRLAIAIITPFPSLNRIITMSEEEILRKYLPGTYYPQYVEALPQPLIRSMRSQRIPFRSTDTFGNDVSFYIADMSIETDPLTGQTLWLYDASRQDFCVDQHTGDTHCADCLNDDPPADAPNFGVSWHSEGGYDTITCSNCGKTIYSPIE